ncbi:hypothetical protein Tco_1454764, partial [Tanacetum coccineum]
LLQRLHAVEKAATKWQATTNVALCCEGCNKAYLQLRRLPHRLQATAKAATLLTGCYKGCYKDYNSALWLMRRLPYRLQAAVKLMRRLPHRLKANVKAAVKVVGFYKGCHIAEKVAMLLKRLYRGYGLDIFHKTNPNRGSFKGLIIAGPTDDATDYAKRSTYQAPMVEMLRPLGSEEGPSTGPLTRPSTGPSIGPSMRPSRRRPGGLRGEGRGLRGEGRGSSLNLT